LALNSFDEEQLDLLRRLREAYEKVQQTPDHSRTDYGNIYQEIVRRFMLPHVPPNLKLVSKVKIRAQRLRNINLALIKDFAFDDKDRIPPQSVHTVIQVKGFGTSGVGPIPDEIRQKIEGMGFYQISKMFPHIRGAYLVIREREGIYINAVRDFLGSRVFFLSEGDYNFERKPYLGEWKKFIDYVISS